MKEIYKVIIVDDHKLFREGLVFMISKMKGFEVVGEASNGIAFLELIEKVDADIVIMDIAMPGLMELTRQPELWKNIQISNLLL